MMGDGTPGSQESDPESGDDNQDLSLDSKDSTVGNMYIA